jgi:hypothetical protein
MGRLGGTAMACSVCVWLVAGITQAVAAKPAGVPPERAAAVIAAVIRQDAHDQFRQSRLAVTVTQECCGRQVLRVHYRAAARGELKKDAYVLRLETKRGVVSGVSVSEAASEAGYSADIGSWKNEWQREFEIRSDSHGADNSWEYGVSSSDVSQFAGGQRGGGPIGLGSSRECQLPAAVPAALYREVLATLSKASHHVSSGAPAFSSC